MKILILCPFTHPSICGVWTRAYNDAKYLIKQGHEVHIFSSNIVKGTCKKSSSYELYQNIHIHRFPVLINLGENAKLWSFKAELLKLKPDIIHSHVYRHPHTHKSSILAAKLKIPFIVTTHAPFVEKQLRNKKTNMLVYFYDSFLAKKFFKRCVRVIAITRWELPYLEKLGCAKEKIVYLPNGISEEFFKVRPKKSKIPNLLFLGRIAPIKNIECIIKAISILKKEKVKVSLDIIGPAEEQYLNRLKQLTKQLNLEKEVSFKKPVYSLGEKLKAYQNHSIFVLPSWREALPSSLLEAMASGLTVISSKTQGGLEIIQDSKTGYLFEINNEKELAEKLKLAIKKSVNARQKARGFALDKINPKLEELYKSILNQNK